MFLDCKNLIKILPIIRFELYNSKENNFLIPTKFLNTVLIIIKNHFKCQFKVLSCISAIDYPDNFYRFVIVYEFLSLKFNTRLRLKILVNCLIPIGTIENLFLAAS